MSAVIAATCTCGSVGRTDLRQCPDHFHIWRGDVRLPSVGRVIRDLFPKADIPADVLENARERGEQLDRLFADYVRGKLRAIPAGTRMDAVALFEKARKWYDRQRFNSVQVQVLLGGEHHGGICDFCFDGLWVDLKGTYDARPEHYLQVGGYMAIAAENALECWGEAKPGAILHVTERYKEPRLLPVEVKEAQDFTALAAAWRLIQSRVSA